MTSTTNATASMLTPDTKKTHTPGFKLTQDERAKKFDEHDYGLCVSCDTGLDDPVDFTCDPRLPGGFALMCCVPHVSTITTRMAMSAVDMVHSQMHPQ